MNKYLLLALLLLAVVACRKDTEETTITETRYKPPVVKVTGNVAGRVVYENSTWGPEGIKVYIGSQQVTTGPDGYFLFKNAELNANGTYIRIDPSIYGHASKLFFPRPNTTNYIELSMMQDGTHTGISAQQGGTVTLPSGATVTLPANGIVTTAGLPYNGWVYVSAWWLDPSDPDLAKKMPGNLVGIDKDERQAVLASYGMIRVTMRNSNTNEPLQLAPNAEAELFFPLPPAMRNTAPAEIPLWHFDEDAGWWREEGKALRQNDGYVGRVKHFSFWNCDAPFPVVSFRGRIVTEGARPVSNVWVKIYSPTRNLTGTGYTDQLGVFNGLIPANEPLVMEMVTACNEVITRNIGPFSSAADVGDIIVADPRLRTLNVSGRLLNCAGIPIQGIVRVCWENGCQFLAADANGYFNQRITHCPGTYLTYRGIDMTSSWQNGQRMVMTAGDATESVLGDVVVCPPNSESYIRINVLGEEELFLPPVYISYPADNFVLLSATNSAGSSISIGFNTLRRRGLFREGQVILNYTGQRMINGQTTDISIACNQGDCPGNLNVFVAQYIPDEFPGIAEGSFEGNLNVTRPGGQTLFNVPVFGEFKLVY